MLKSKNFDRRNGSIIFCDPFTFDFPVPLTLSQYVGNQPSTNDFPFLFYFTCHMDSTLVSFQSTLLNSVLNNL